MSDNVVKLLSWVAWGLTPFFVFFAVSIHVNLTDAADGNRGDAEAMLGYWWIMAPLMLAAMAYDIKTAAVGDVDVMWRAAQGLRALLIAASLAAVWLGVTYSPFA